MKQQQPQELTQAIEQKQLTYTKTAAQAGRGTTLGIGSGTPVLIGEIRSISLDGNQWETADVTNMQSGFTKEFINTILDSGEFTTVCNRVSSDAGQVALESAFEGANAGVVQSFTLTLLKSGTQTTTGDVFVFNALVQSSNFSIEPTKETSVTAKLKVTGVKTFTPGT